MTTGFDEQAQGWTSFYSFIPDWMLRLGNRFFTLKDGQLYLHNDPTVPRNNFYGVQYSSKISFTMNQSPSDIKVFKSLGIEGNQPWETVIKAFQSGTENYSQSTLANTEFVKKEGYWYAHTRRNELSTTESKATYGIGIVTEVTGSVITVSQPFDGEWGDEVYTEDGTLLGHITLVGDTYLHLDTNVPPVEGTFIYGSKNVRTEGGEIRGYTSVVEMENDTTDKLELFAVNSEVFKSHR